MRLSTAMGRDVPLVDGTNVQAIAAGSAADTTLVVCEIPDLTHSFLPNALNQGIQGQLPVNSLSVRQSVFVSGGAANTVGNATNNCEYRLNVWRKGVLQGCISYYNMAVATTIGTAVSAAGVATVTPASMANIVPGMVLAVNSTDIVYVISTTSTTFTANFGATHTTADTVTSVFVPFRPIEFVPAISPSTTVGGAVSAGAGQVVTPGNIHGIHVGDYLLIDTVASGVQETVLVTAVTDTTFTATFANAHTSSAPVIAATSSQFILKGGDVIAFKRISNNVTGLATPVGLIQCEFVPAVINR